MLLLPRVDARGATGRQVGSLAERATAAAPPGRHPLRADSAGGARLEMVIWCPGSKRPDHRRRQRAAADCRRRAASEGRICCASRLRARDNSVGKKTHRHTARQSNVDDSSSDRAKAMKEYLGRVRVLFRAHNPPESYLLPVFYHVSLKNSILSQRDTEDLIFFCRGSVTTYITRILLSQKT